MEEDHSPAPSAAAFTADEGRQIWEIARGLALGSIIPPERGDEVRAELRDLILARPDYYAGRGEDFIPLVKTGMRHRLLDIVDRLAGRREKFFSAFEPYELTDAETGETYERGDVLDIDKTDDFFNNLDRKDALRRLRNWRRRFNARMRRLDPELRRFVFALATTTTQDELSSASGIGRKGCYLRRLRLRETFADLLADWKAIRACL